MEGGQVLVQTRPLDWAFGAKEFFDRNTESLVEWAGLRGFDPWPPQIKTDNIQIIVFSLVVDPSPPYIRAEGVQFEMF